MHGHTWTGPHAAVLSTSCRNKIIADAASACAQLPLALEHILEFVASMEVTTQDAPPEPYTDADERASYNEGIATAIRTRTRELCLTMTQTLAVWTQNVANEGTPDALSLTGITIAQVAAAKAYLGPGMVVHELDHGRGHLSIT